MKPTTGLVLKKPRNQQGIKHFWDMSVVMAGRDTPGWSVANCATVHRTDTRRIV